MIGKHDSSVWVIALFQYSLKPSSIEDIISQNQSHFIVSDEFLSKNKSLSQTVGYLLFDIFKYTSQILSISE